MSIFKFILSTLLLFFILSSCNKDETTTSPPPVPRVTLWEVNASIDNELIVDSFQLTMTVDPVQDSDSIWIEESHQRFWNFSIKASADKNIELFETSHSRCKNDIRGIGVKIPSGQIVDRDSIWFDIQFEDDETPYGLTYRIAGRRIS